MLLVASLALSLNLAPLRPPAATRCASIRCAEAATEEAAVATTIEYGGIPHVGVIIGDAEEAREFYTGVLGMVDVTDEEDLEHPGAAMRVGEQVIYLQEINNPDPIAVDPTYNMSMPPPGYVAEGRPVHAGRDRHVAITLNDLGPIKDRLEAANHPYTMSYSGRQALFTRDNYGNGWEFGPPVTYEKATRLFPPYLVPPEAKAEAATTWGGMPHVGLLVADTEKARVFYCDVLGMVDENDLRPDKLPFPGLFLRCGEQQVHILELPNPDPNTVNDRPGYGKDRRTAYSVKDLKPLRAALDGAGVPYAMDPKQTTLWCYDPDANEQMFIKDESIQPIMEAYDGPMVPWTRLWDP